jgi:serine/threonine-protein kinase
MDIINEKIWNAIQNYIDEDIDNIDDIREIEETLRKLKKDHPDYYNEIKTLLEQRKKATNFFADLGSEIQNSVEEDYFQRGYKIGVYQIDKIISSGGMSNVYLANRVDGQFDQQVAIKVLKESIDNKTLQDQFQREMQILASLNHPNIATIYDGGLTNDGRPYFIMEYIDGKSITDYCDHHQLTIEERLHLFGEVTSAVNYAHQNLVIHKDLKPGNILVDKNGYLKLMDFGVAQIIQEKTTETTDFRAFTPKYASPEQINYQKVTTLSDIYQLGVLLHKLLTGLHPSYDQKKQILPPLHQFNKLSINDQYHILTSRKIYARKKLSNKIKGDLDAILKLALHSNPHDRYNTVMEMQSDIQNYFDNQPVKAKGEHFNYLFSKFIRRNRSKINVALLFIGIIAALTINYTIEITHQKDEAQKNAQRAKQSASRAKSVTNYLKSIFMLGDPFVNSAKNITVDQMLEMGYERLNNSTDLDPDVKANILITMAEVLRENEKFDKSLEALQKSHLIIDSIKPENHLDKRRIYTQYADHFRKFRQLDTAFYFIHKALKIDSLYKDEHPVNLTYDLEELGKIYALKKDYNQAIPIYKKVIERMETHETVDNEKIKAGVESTLGEIYFKLSEYDSARKYIFRAYQVHSNLKDTMNSYLVNDLSKIAALYLELEKLDSASLFIDESIKKTRQVYGDTSIKLINRYYTASRIAKKKNDFSKALNYARKAYKIAEKNYGKNHIRTAYRLNTLGLTYKDFGMPEKSEKYLRKALQIKEDNYPEYKHSISIAQYNLAESLLKQGETQKALQLFRKVYKIEKELYPENHPSFAYTMTKLGRTLIDSENPDEAYPLLKKAYAIVEEKFDSVHSRRASCATALAEYYLKKQKWKQASEYAKEGMIIYEQINGKDHWSYEYTSALNILAKQAVNNNIQYSGQIKKIIHSMRKQPFVENYYLNKITQYARELDINLPEDAAA